MFENDKDALNLKRLQPASSNLHKRYLVYIFYCYMFNVKWGYPIKTPYISLIIATQGLECENNLQEVMGWESYPSGVFDL